MDLERRVDALKKSQAGGGLASRDVGARPGAARMPLRRGVTLDGSRMSDVTTRMVLHTLIEMVTDLNDVVMATADFPDVHRYRRKFIDHLKTLNALFVRLKSHRLTGSTRGFRRWKTARRSARPISSGRYMSSTLTNEREITVKKSNKGGDASGVERGA